jgi:Tol biopolymer transport system component
VTPERWQRVKEVFQSARDRAPEDRDAYLVAEGGDSELRREVERMLRHADGTGLLDTPAWDGLGREGRLAAGSRLGPYEILREIGAGGMGCVYQARDTRLGRIVAIKVLSAEFSHRLRLEGRAISALNHPHVCALYDIGDQEGIAYLVMEYVEGESLAARLVRGPLPIDAVLGTGAEIAAALSAAHAQSIVHRDLKPANIMLTATGAKVLDFGVALIAEDEESTSGVAGTAAYMSPSQLNGNPAAPRTDIFALGLVLYEMATGRRYVRESAGVVAGIPRGLASLIERCLCLDATGRFQDMNEVRRELERLRSESGHPGGWKKQAGTLLAMTVAAFALAWWLVPRPVVTKVVRTPEPRPMETPAAAASPAPAAKVPSAPVVRRNPPAPPVLSTLASYPGMERDPSFSPDGAKVAFSWHGGGVRGYGISVRPVKSEAAPVALTSGMSEDWGPAWAPDGRTIAFRRRDKESGIYLVPASGGSAALLAPIARQNQETLPQMSWSHDGKWIAAPDRDSTGATQIHLFDVASGAKRAITFNTEGTDHAPAFSPDGKSLAFASCMHGVYPCDVFVLRFGADFAPIERRRITDEGVYIRGIAWLPDGKGVVYSAGRRVSMDTFLFRVSVNPPGLPERIDLAGSQARHPTISKTAGLLAYTRFGTWSLMVIGNFR